MEILIKFSENLILQIGYGGIIILMALESTATPVVSEIVMGLSGFLVAQGFFNLYIASLAGAIGSLLGSIFSYIVGFGMYEFLRKNFYFSFFVKKINKSEILVQKYGVWGIFIARFLPGIRHFISFPAGFFRLKIIPFSLATFLGSFLWCFFLVWLGKELKENWIKIYSFFNNYKIIVLLAGLFIFLLIVMFGRSFKK